MRQQPGLLQNGDGRRPQIPGGRVVAVRIQPLARGGPAILRAVPQGEQRLRASCRRALAGDVDDLVEIQIGRGQPPRDGREGAVMAPVPAQPGQRDEHLRRIGDRVRPAGRAQSGGTDPRGRPGQISKIVSAGGHQDSRLHRIEERAVTGPPQRAP